MHLGAPITSRSNARVKALRAAFSGDASQPGDLLALEGEHLIAEALRSHITFDTIYLRAGSESILDRPSLAGLQSGNWALLSRDAFSSAVDTASPQGIAATIAIPALPLPNVHRTPGITLVLESLQDPGNLGTLLRSAEAFGVRQVFATPETVNHWNPKAVRASAGSVFRMPVSRQPLESIFTWLNTHHIKSFAAVASSHNATPLMNAHLLPPCAIVIGNEGAGLSAEALRLSSARVHIPCAVESLNAAIAGSVLLYETTRQSQKLTTNHEPLLL
jgi:TrmH family RNA methyltransferase